MATTTKVLHVAGWESCGFFARALSVVRSVSLLFPSKLKVIPHTFDNRQAFRAWLVENDNGFRQHFTDARAHSHTSSPFCWFSNSDNADPDPAQIESFLGGHDDTLAWCRQFLSPSTETTTTSTNNNNEVQHQPDGHVANQQHAYDYDLIVLGGGSGGMAAAKEAAAHGAKVACLDFVKPSPAGTKWGLGGTCVNVGCIPKKLYHAAALLHENAQLDTPAFGVQIGAEMKTQEEMAETERPPTVVHWGVLRENIQNYIRSLNFKYRVRLREKEVTYLNKLGTFQDAHTLQAVDKKGRTSTLTASRFLIATGGRPTPLNCPGAELAISSDDVFFLERNPGKTLCVGASYISLECAGFLAGLGNDVTIAVRSILLRGFDQECAEKIGDYMKEHGGVKFKRQVTPTKLEKVANTDQIQVTFSDGTVDTYDTVLAAIGRQADTAQLGLDKIGVTVNPKNGRILATNEQTACPNVYAVGDVLDGTPELTPVAIQAGIALSRRLFGGSKEPMDYKNVCTTVFTPIEYACVGLSEDEAMEKLGKDNVEVYHRDFLPLEWSLSNARSHSMAFCKAIVDKTDNDKILGLHYVGPNAGEVMQGYGVAMKRGGMTYKELTDTVGIHPTCSEELVTLTITKGSGVDSADGGC